MSDENTSLIGAFQALFGGATTTLLAASLGRLVYHGQEVSNGRRPLFGRHLIWEVPTAVAMALVAEAVAQYAGFDQQVTTGIVAVMAYLGPRGLREIVDRLLATRK